MVEIGGLTVRDEDWREELAKVRADTAAFLADQVALLLHESVDRAEAKSRNIPSKKVN